MIQSKSAACLGLLIACVVPAPPGNAQTTVTLTPTLDNAIFSERPDNAAGADENVFVGVTNEGGERRALLAFQDLSAIPAGATITNVELTLAVTNSAGGSPSIPLSLFATTTPWGEGSANASGAGGRGAEPGAGDATWNQAVAPDTNWMTAGGDFASEELSSTNSGTGGAFTFPSSGALVNQVQNWLDGGDNSGLIVVSQSSQNRSAKRLGSRENPSPANRPQLNVTFTGGGGSNRALRGSGLWFDADLPGDGFNVIESAPVAAKGAVSESNRITIFFFGYDATGNRLWLVSDTIDGPFFQDQPLSFPMLVGGTSGSFQIPAPGSELSSWGTLEVTLDGCSSGVFNLSGADGDKRIDATQLTAVDGQECELTQSP